MLPEAKFELTFGLELRNTNVICDWSVLWYESESQNHKNSDNKTLIRRFYACLFYQARKRSMSGSFSYCFQAILVELARNINQSVTGGSRKIKI